MPITVRAPEANSVQDNVALPPKVPQLPEDVFERFPSLRTYQESQNKWWVRASVAIQQFAGAVGDEVDETSGTLGDLFVSFNQFTASITTTVEAIATEQGAMARRIVTVSAMAGKSQNIKVQTTAPVGPVLNDIWINNSVLTLPITYQWDGATWVEVTTPISVAAVADERTARVTADGFLEGKYTLTVIAGDVVTGMNITSSSGGGTNVSSVIFRATDFKIYNGTTGITMFDVSGSTVRLAGTLTVSTSGKVFIGTGTYANSNTPWYVDSSGNFSLGNKLTWDGTTLVIGGGISATSGTIGGWDITSTTLNKNNAILDSAGQLALGTSNDVVILSATHGTYRLWIGNATAGSAAFNVTKAGVMSATGGIFSGSITSTSGTIGGFDIGSDSLAGGVAPNRVRLLGGIFSGSILIGSLTTPTGATNVNINSGGLTLGILTAPNTNAVMGQWNAATGALTLNGPLKIDNAKSAGSPTPGGTVTILDSTGATISLITT